MSPRIRQPFRTTNATPASALVSRRLRSRMPVTLALSQPRDACSRCIVTTRSDIVVSCLSASRLKTLRGPSERADSGNGPDVGRHHGSSATRPFHRRRRRMARRIHGAERRRIRGPTRTSHRTDPCEDGVHGKRTTKASPPTSLPTVTRRPGQGDQDGAHEGFDRWRKESAIGGIGTGIARGLQAVFAPPPDEVVIVAAVPGDPPDADTRVRVILDPDDPTKSIAVVPTPPVDHPSE